MFPIALINSHGVMQRSLHGSNATDPVVPERSKRRLHRRAGSQRATRRLLVLKPRGTS